MVQNNDSLPFHLHPQQQQPPDTIYGDLCHVVLSCPQSIAYVKNYFRPFIREEVERKIKAYLNQISFSSCSTSITNMKDDDEDQDHGAVVGGGGGSRSENDILELCFMNKIPSIIFTMNEIQAENGEELQIGLFHVVNGNYIVDIAHPLSSALIEVVVLDGEFDDGKAITRSDFEKSVVSQRQLGERPWLAGDGKRFRLKNGVSSITNLSFTRNSSRTRTKNIRLGLRVTHDSTTTTNNNYPTIQHAVSNPFRVKDHRGQLNKKHHPPRGEDEVWRLEGIRRNGEYHNRLSSQGILTVESFVKAHQSDYRSLRKLLGTRLSDKKWKIMVNHAFEYVPITIPTFDPPTIVEQNLVQNEAMEAGAVINGDFDQNIGASNGDWSFPDQKLLCEFRDFYNRMFEDNSTIQTLLSQGEASTLNGQKNHVENTSTSNQYFQGAWTKLVPKPK